jgi:hypothetical protein
MVLNQEMMAKVIRFKGRGKGERRPGNYRGYNWSFHANPTIAWLYLHIILSIMKRDLYYLPRTDILNDILFKRVMVRTFSALIFSYLNGSKGLRRYMGGIKLLDIPNLPVKVSLRLSIS